MISLLSLKSVNFIFLSPETVAENAGTFLFNAVLAIYQTTLLFDGFQDCVDIQLVTKFHEFFS